MKQTPKEHAVLNKEPTEGHLSNIGQGENPWPIFDVFPKLQPHLAPIALCDLPTSVQALKGLSESAWVKRDDLTHKRYGGNKTRKFEFIAAHILAANKKHVVTLGGTGTNHGVATAMVCQQLGLKCTVITFNQPDSKFVQKNQSLMKNFGATVINAGPVALAALRFYVNPRRLHKDYYFLPGGGAIPVATMAYVNAAFELKCQIEKQQCPEPAEIYIPVGSASTLAGLTLGCALAGLKSKVIGIRVLDAYMGPVETCTESVVNTLMAQARDVLLQDYPQAIKELPKVILRSDFFAPGYGVLTPATTHAMKQAQALGLTLDQTYSGKAFDAYLKALKTTRKPILYWATYNSSAEPAGLVVM